MWVSRKKHDELVRELLRSQEELSEARMNLQYKALCERKIEGELKKAREEIETLNASLDATVAALEQTRNALAVSEAQRKRLLKERGERK